MEDFVDVSKIDKQIIASISNLLMIREAAYNYAKLPSYENGEELFSCVDKASSLDESLKLNLAVMVKQSNGIHNEIVVKQSDNGIEL